MEINEVKKLQEIITESRQIVFFGGAGVSTESGIPDFRSIDGLYHQKWDWPPEEILSNSFFYEKTKEFYRFYREKLIIHGIKPNITHYKLAELEENGKLLAIITQNIDGLHQSAGNRRVYELHGSTLRNYCTNCNEFYDLDYIDTHSDKNGLPLCEKCGGLIKPDVVLYGENLNDSIVNGAISALKKADLLIIGGTSLTVYPAAGLIRYFGGKNLVLINKDPTPSDNIADLVIHDSLGKIFEKIKC